MLTLLRWEIRLVLQVTINVKKRESQSDLFGGVVLKMSSIKVSGTVAPGFEPVRDQGRLEFKESQHHMYRVAHLVG